MDGGFGDDVRVEAVAEVDRVDVVTEYALRLASSSMFSTASTSQTG